MTKNINILGSTWTVTHEELVDWIAIQFPRIAEVYEKLECM